MEKLEGESKGSAGPPGPAQPQHQKPGAEAGNVVNGEGLSIVPATPEQRAAIAALPEGRTVLLSGLKWAGQFLLLATLSGGLACGMAPHGAHDGHHHRHHGGRKPGPAHSAQHPANAGRRREEDGENQASKIEPSTPNIQGETAEILQLTRRQTALLEQLVQGRAAATAAKAVIHRIGRLEYREGFADVWLDDEHFDLRGRTQARFCLKDLVDHGAFNVASARHFETEIDPYVRDMSGLGGRGKFSEVQIKAYFNDRAGHLSKLHQSLIRRVPGAGKFYLATGLA